MSFGRGLQIPDDYHLLFNLLIRPLTERHGTSLHHAPHKVLEPVHHLHAQPDRVRHPVRLHAALPHLLLRWCQRLALRRARLQSRTLSLLHQPLWYALYIVKGISYFYFVVLWRLHNYILNNWYSSLHPYQVCANFNTEERCYNVLKCKSELCSENLTT